MDPNARAVNADVCEGGQLSAVVVASVRLYREGLAEALARMGQVRIVATCAAADAAKAMIDELGPDTAIVDISMPDALDLIRQMRAKAVGTRVIAFGIEEDIWKILDCAKAGAAGYVTANASIDELLSAMRRAVAGELLCTPQVAAELFRCIGEMVDGAGSTDASLPLTPRELQVFGCVQQGLSNKEIAAALSIAESTVKNHVHHLLEKLQVETRGQAAARVTLNPQRPGFSELRRKRINRELCPEFETDLRRSRR
jgi:two-component system, NarL family, nitrate/nitrite response regulator NarL